MQLTKKEKTIKYVAYCAIIVVASLLQNVAGLWLEIGSARCLFLLPVTVVLGISEDEKIAALLGFFGGLLWDTVSAQHMGFNCIYLMLVCYISSALVTYLFRDTYWVSAISSFVATGLYCIIYWLFFVVIGGSKGSAASMWYFYLPCFIYTSVIAMALCWLIREVKAYLNHDTEVEQ